MQKRRVNKQQAMQSGKRNMSGGWYKDKAIR